MSLVDYARSRKCPLCDLVPEVQSEMTEAFKGHKLGRFPFAMIRDWLAAEHGVAAEHAVIMGHLKSDHYGKR